MSKYISIALVTLLLSACSSAPRQVDASLLLINKSTAPIGQVIPQQLWRILSEPGTQRINYKKYQITILPMYRSALGYECRQLEFYENGLKIQTRAACEVMDSPHPQGKTKAWYLIDNIERDTSVVSL